MTKGRPPTVNFSAVEKNLVYVGYDAIVLTTTPLSITRGLRPARCADTAAARPHGPAPTITRSASFLIGLTLRSGYADRSCWERALHTNDLIATGAHTDVSDLRFNQRLNAI